MRKVISFLLVCVTVFLLVTMSAMAAGSGKNSISARLNSTTCSLKISGMTAESSCNVILRGTDKATVTLSLQKYKNGKWTVVQSTTKSTTGARLSFSRKKLITAGKFRAKAVVTAIRGNTRETKNYYSSIVTK
ncbi:Uncharacterised protein [uncultured Roseburia sp.]|uniref:Uncharacterized protein n=1 Tax=Brotonthovivens ammoniilytica TaxID=2981725 RepID=A0ABT2TK00_9FIRM|nr:hypothetical protein [Brotonthovivens ammoniilytica]MCU6762535.1 hypothetical protein [Brotonthovivens ammoniilytica]SCI74995.1 Uncharacterised protein [uncultured Roseburia sp.]